MPSYLISILTFLAAFLAVWSGNALLVDLFDSERKRRRQQLDETVREQQRRRARQDFSNQDLSKLAAEVRAELRDPQDWRSRLQFKLDQSGLGWELKTLVNYTLVAAAVGAALGLVLTWGPLGAIAGALMCGVLPYLYVLLKRSARLEKMRAQLPDAFDLMSRVMRSGQTIQQAMTSVAEEFASPISLEFLYCYEQMNLGLSAEAALRELGRRTGLLEIRIFVLAVVVHRQTGGNLAQLLDNLAHVVRERFRIRGMIKSLTAQGRFQAIILLSLPVGMFCLLMALRPEYEMLLLQYPLMIFAALGMMAIGGYWIHKVVSFDY